MQAGFKEEIVRLREKEKASAEGAAAAAAEVVAAPPVSAEGQEEYANADIM